ncbi:MAG: protein translocase subunit SecD [Planctomycetota bacterium]
MVENVARKVTFVTLALLVSLAFLLIPDKPFQMGLDLQGGTRLVYRFDFDEARRQDLISEQEAQDPSLILSQVVNIVRNRVDPTGLREAVIRQEGTERIVVELPGTPDLSTVDASSTIAEDLDALSSLGIQLDPNNASAADFPEGGGTVQIGDEKIHYSQRDGYRLLNLQRGFRLTPKSGHGAGAEVLLSSDDAIKDLIENLGELSFAIQAVASDLTGTGTDLTAEGQKLDEWVAANPGLSLVNFNKVEPEDGGPNARIKWLPTAAKSEEASLLAERDRAVPLLRPENPDYEFAGADISKVYPSQDSSGFPAVGFEMKPSRKGDFGDFTGDNIDRLLCITLNDQVESTATINDRLSGASIIQGRFTPDEVNDLITVIRSGSLPIKPELEHEEVVGPTLGQQYVDRGVYSGVLGILAVLAFVIFYYRRLGVFATLALTANLIMLLGGLAFLRATVTLPGIAGVILTVGMAVDANILIFDRIREELDKGQNVKQAAKTGFEKAFSAVFDANITTLITAIILYRVGTGPVRGFAVTLSIGIIGSMISALIITRLLVHWSLERNVKAFPMGKWLVKANYDFIGKAKVAAMASLAAIVLGVGFFAVQPAGKKLGIDFLGGAEVQIRTEVAENVDKVRDLVGAIPGAIGETAEVKPVLGTEAESDSFTSFRIAFKVDDAAQDQDVESGLKRELETNLADILQKGPIEVSEPRPDGAFTDWDVTLYFVDQHPVADVHAQLTEKGLQSPAFASDGSRPNVLSGTVRSSAMQKGEMESLLGTAFNRKEDSNGNAFDLAQPIPSSTLVGPQVVGELRNKAIIALMVSLFAIVLYIRVRFAEYSYGWAAVAALTHDVLITLGALTLFNALGIINGEISLPMVAAFLTIIGYSLNDTIVIFDRVRENLPRMKKPLAEILNISINQTLSRTLLTSVTTLIAVTLLFVFNFGTGNTLEGFSFAMIVGVLTGTYSTIFIANPVLLWLENRADKKGTGARAHMEQEKQSKKEDEKALAAS